MAHHAHAFPKLLSLVNKQYELRLPGNAVINRPIDAISLWSMQTCS